MRLVFRNGKKIEISLLALSRSTQEFYWVEFDPKTYWTKFHD